MVDGETRFRTYVDNAPYGVFIADRRGRYVEVNPAAERITGYTAAQLTSMCIADIVAPEARDAALAGFGRVVEQGGARAEGPFLHASGETRYWAVSATRLSDDRFIGFVEDITDRRRAEEALRESERYVRSILDTAGDGFLTIDRRGRVTDVNAAYCAMSGYARDELLGMDARQLDPHEPADALVRRVRRVMEAGSGVFERSHVRKDGGRLPVEVSVTYVGERGGCFVCFCRDLTERKQREERIAQLGRMVDAAPASITVHDTEGRFLYANQETVRLHGYRDEAEFLAVDLRRLDVPESAALVAERMARIARDGEARFEVAHYRKDGSSFPLDVHVKRIDWGGRPVVLSIASDITERRRAEEKLRESEERYRALVMQSADCLILHDLDGRIVDVNPCSCETYGYTREEMLTMRVSDLDPDYVERADHGAFYRQMRPGRAVQFEARQKTKDGRILPVDVRISLVRLGGQTLIQGLCRDITERKKAREERERLREQLNHAQKLESVGRLAGGVAHDFNNMLGVILGNIEIALLDVDPGSDVHADLKEAHLAARRSANLTRQLLAFARKQTIAPRVLDLNDTVAGMLKMVRRLIGEHIELTWVPGNGLWPVKVDPSQIDQILANLCVNARDAIAGVGAITIRTRNAGFDLDDVARCPSILPGEFVQITVSDDGCGMDEATLARIYEPFFTTKGPGKGTGLGLAMVYGIARQNEGFVQVQSAPGQGATFTVSLPRHRQQASEQEVEARSEPVAASARETVLVVEDEVAVLRVATRMLENLGYAVLAASSPGEAMRLARAHGGGIDLLLTDVVMPGMNGRELARKLCADRPRLRCLFMSGHPADVIADDGVVEQGLVHIEKPFSRRDLAAKVREALDRPPSA